MASYQINNLDSENNCATVLFMADDGTQAVEIVDNLPLHNVTETKAALTERLADWQATLNANQTETPVTELPVDPALESILFMQQTPATDTDGNIIVETNNEEIAQNG